MSSPRARKQTFIHTGDLRFYEVEVLFPVWYRFPDRDQPGGQGVFPDHLRNSVNKVVRQGLVSSTLLHLAGISQHGK